MRFSLFIQDSPESGAAVASALGFAIAAVAAGHELRQMFFHGDGVRSARASAEADHDLRAWSPTARFKRAAWGNGATPWTRLIAS